MDNNDKIFAAVKAASLVGNAVAVRKLLKQHEEMNSICIYKHTQFFGTTFYYNNSEHGLGVLMEVLRKIRKEHDRFWKVGDLLLGMLEGKNHSDITRNIEQYVRTFCNIESDSPLALELLLSYRFVIDVKKDLLTCSLYDALRRVRVITFTKSHNVY